MSAFLPKRSSSGLGTGAAGAGALFCLWRGNTIDSMVRTISTIRIISRNFPMMLIQGAFNKSAAGT